MRGPQSSFLALVSLVGVCAQNPVAKMSIVEDTLAIHNVLRWAHGAPTLEWSDECAPQLEITYRLSEYREYIC